MGVGEEEEYRVCFKQAMFMLATFSNFGLLYIQGVLKIRTHLGFCNVSSLKAVKR